MPPRYVYWTIIVDGQPTAFRSGSLEDIMPTFNRLKEKQPSAELKWWQNGQLWPSRHDAQDSMRARGDRGRAKDPRQADDPDRPKPERAWNAKPEWKTRSSFAPRGDKPSFAPRSSGASEGRPFVAKPAGKPEWKPKGDGVASGFSRSRSDEKPAWTPKGSFTPAPRKSFGDGNDKPSFAPRSSGASEGKPEWKPRGTFKPKDTGHRSASDDKPAWKPKGDAGDKPAWKPRSASARTSFGDREDKPEWKGQAHSDRKPEWKPKGTFKPKEAGHASGWGEKPGWKPTGEKPAWKSRPGGSARDQARSSFQPKSYTPKDDGAGPTRSSKARDQKLDWSPKAESRPGGPNAGFAKSDPDAPKRKWVPKAEYKKSLGIEVKRDDKWRPGGQHVDPKQKYKDAKKAKWTRVKATIRARSSKPRKPKDE